MKSKSLLFFILFLNLLSAQESNDKTIYVDSLWHEVPQGNHKYYKVIKDYNLDKIAYTVFEYYKSGKILSEGIFKDKEAKIRNGETTFYYENGNKKIKKYYSDNNPYGKATYWYENGKIKEEGEYFDTGNKNDKLYKIIGFWNQEGQQTVVDGNGNYESDGEFFIEKGIIKEGVKNGTWTGQNKTKNYSYTEKYESGNFINGERTDENGKTSQYLVMEKRPEPKNGIQDFYNYIGSHFKYTKASIIDKVQGRIIMTFVVDNEGKIVEAKILRGLGYGLDEEAIRVVTNYGKWIPGEQRGVKVRCLYSLPITLKAE